MTATVSHAAAELTKLIARREVCKPARIAVAAFEPDRERNVRRSARRMRLRPGGRLAKHLEQVTRTLVSAIHTFDHR
jgi:hypothetical protein